MKGRVVVLKAYQAPFEIQEYEVPDPEPGAVLLRMTQAGICGSDLHSWRGDRQQRFQPVPDGGVAMGHEGSGVIARLGPDVAELTGASSRVYLTRHPAGSFPFAGASAPRAYRRHWTPVHLDFVVSDLAVAIQRAESEGAVQEGEIREFDWGRYAVMADPFGNGFCLLAFARGDYPDPATTAE